jgi:hypothetical protein
VDDLIADFVESLDLDNTILLVTGDHGESFGEDGGRYHGGALSDVQTQVPAVLWGPGVPANRSVAFPTSLNDTNRMELHVLPNRGGHVVLVALLDNLGKGASGVAIQSLNLMLGLGETTGLPA